MIDLSTEGGVVATLQESQVNCLAEEKVRLDSRSSLEFS